MINALAYKHITDVSLPGHSMFGGKPPSLVVSPVPKDGLFFDSGIYNQEKHERSNKKVIFYNFFSCIQKIYSEKKDTKVTLENEVHFFIIPTGTFRNVSFFLVYLFLLTLSSFSLNIYLKTFPLLL